MILDKARIVLKKDFLTAVRYRNGLVLKAVAPVAQLATFYYLARAVGPHFRPDGMPYFLFLIIGTGFYTFLLTGMHTFLQTIQESQQTGTLEVLMSTATPPSALLSLSAISAFSGGFLQLIFYVGAGMVLFHPALRLNIPGSFLVFVLSVLISIAIGMFAAGLQILAHKGSVVLWVLGSSAWVMAGTLFPVGVLPRPVQVLSQLLPLTHSLNGMRLALFPWQNSGSLSREIAILSVFAATLLPVSILFFSLTVKRARQCGTLSFY